MTVSLPDRYCQIMKEFLKEDYPAWQDSFLALPFKGIRINDLKIDAAAFAELWERCGGREENLEPIDWIPNGFFIKDTATFSSHPFYQAGLYYIQEPSAMTPAEILPVEPGNIVLDLCAAPGGKTTQLLAKLRGMGILYANDISASRAKALRKNVEMAGAANAFVTAESPEKLAASFPGFFDRILVDAPCSGEGMFRRKPEMAGEWEERGPDYYAPLQREILDKAAFLLASGGLMAYSTCTFSELENEGSVEWLLGKHPEMEICNIPDYEGFLRSRVAGLHGCIRIMPHRMSGEGQFVCLMRKKGAAGDRLPVQWEAGDRLPVQRATKDRMLVERVARDNPLTKRAARGKTGNDGFSLYERGGQIYLLPGGHKIRPGIRYLMTGLYVGDQKSGKVRPSQALAQALRAEEWSRVLNLPVGDGRLLRYLRGESIEYSKEEIVIQSETSDRVFGVKVEGLVGDILILAEGFPVGFGAENRGILKNRRNPGWRIQ
ncbi:MAG: RsmF rRNA methyltransferase first C-terminal domain-containing protein [Lachnospiraceae bacterium]|nr:RsmF rRNA methyltransferase first C-terminal domain-containing protein [Lachnospiraceae bacterium]